jgi:hypothetical protein
MAGCKLTDSKGTRDVEISDELIEINSRARLVVDEIASILSAAQNELDDFRQQSLYQEIVLLARELEERYRRSADSLAAGDQARAAILALSSYWSLRAEGAEVQMVVAKDRSTVFAQKERLEARTALGDVVDISTTRGKVISAAGIEQAGGSIRPISVLESHSKPATSTESASHPVRSRDETLMESKNTPLHPASRSPEASTPPDSKAHGSDTQGTESNYRRATPEERGAADGPTNTSSFDAEPLDIHAKLRRIGQASTKVKTQNTKQPSENSEA